MGYDTKFKGRFYLNGGLTRQQFKQLDSLAKTRHEDPPMPSIYCGWQLRLDENDMYFLEWDSKEKFYNYVEWIQYITELISDWELKLNGRVFFQGESMGDVGFILVKDNVVTVDKIKIE